MVGFMMVVMVVIEMFFMGKMYCNCKVNVMIVVIGFVVLVVFWFGIWK